MKNDPKMTSASSNFCDRCGMEVSADATFCGECGTTISRKEPTKAVASETDERRDRLTTTSIRESTGAANQRSERSASLQLMPDERVLLQSEGGTLILTTHRVRHQTESFGYARIISIMLEELASCAMLRTSFPLFLVLAALCAAGGLLLTVANRGDAAPLGLGLVLALILVVLFLASRQEIVSLASAGATIRVSTRSMKKDESRHFLDATEAAKNERYLLLKRMDP